jgi:DNA-binding transcriptional LysR family regulator
MHNRHIEAFRAVMLTGAMTAGAEMMHVTQPAVSRLIRDLEAELGLTLFHRRGNAVLPTAEAQALLREVERSFVGLDRIRGFAEDLRTGRGGTLRVAALPSMAAGFLPRFVASFCRLKPNVSLFVDGLPSPLIRDRVAMGQFDIGVTALPFQRDSLAVTPLEDEAVVVMPKNHPLAKRRIVHADDLHDENLILLTRLKEAESNHPIRYVLQSVRYRQMIETPLASIACVLVAEGAGIAFVTPFCASEFVGMGVAVRRFEPSFNIGTAIVHSSERALSLLAQEFHVAFIEHMRRFLEKADYLHS